MDSFFPSTVKQYGLNYQITLEMLLVYPLLRVY